MTRNREDGSTQIQVSKLEMWAIRGVGVLFLGLLGWVGDATRRAADKMEDAASAIVAIQTELAINSPKDILNEVHRLERTRLTEAEVAAVIARASPWRDERQEWAAWRDKMEATIGNIQAQLARMENR